MTALRLDVEGLNVTVRSRQRELPIVREFSLRLTAGECVGLAGESGCGKSMTARALMGLLAAPNTRVSATRMALEGRELDRRNPAGRQDMAMIFQEPSAALDPVFRIGMQMRRAIQRMTGLGQAAARARALESLSEAGFGAPDAISSAYPHELSGGMKQLVMVALASALRPKVLIADEATTALDVTTQARLLDRLESLRESSGTAILLISHDLGVIARSASRCLVMYRGRLVEQADCAELFAHPRHPYTAGLLRARPSIEAAQGELPTPIPGQVPGPGEALPGCAFAPRCPRADDPCHRQTPVMPPEAGAACHHPLGVDPP